MGGTYEQMEEQTSPCGAAALKNNPLLMTYDSTHGFVVIETEASRNFDVTSDPSDRKAICFSLVSLVGNYG